jgi:hypothetical protein
VAQVEVRGSTVVVGTGDAAQVVELGCTGTQVHAAGDRAFVACGEAGVAMVDLAATPARVLLLPQPASVLGVFAAEGTLWARLADGTARPVVTLPGAPAVEPVQPSAPEPEQSAPPRATPSPAELGRPVAPPPRIEVPPPPPRWQPGRAQFEPSRGRVVEAHRDRAHVLFPHPVERGTVVEFLRRAPGGWTGEDTVVARGFVESSGTERARVQLETNTSVEVDMEVRTTSRRGGSWMMPPLALGVAQIALNYRTYLPINTLAVGISGDLTLGYLVNLNGDVGLRLAANLTNIGGVVGVNPAPFSALGHGYVSVAMRYFEVGIGLGASSLSLGGGWSWPPQQRVGFSFGQVLRIGSEDGLSLRLASSVVVASSPGSGGSNERWEFGDLYADGRIPMGHGVWMIVRGGGGNSGLFYGDMGARIRLTGNGLGQSFFFSAAVGFGHVSINTFTNAGPMFSLGLEYRM